MHEDVLADLFRGVGRGGQGKYREVQFSYSRDLNEADLLALQAPQEIRPQPLLKIRHSHHMLARLIAEGRRDTECSLITGYSPMRISLLKQDPAFKELVQHYKTQVDDIYLDVHQRLAALGLNTVEELAERLENDPDSFKNEELMKLAALTFDRGGFGPKSTVQHSGSVAIVTDETLRKIKEEADARRNSSTRVLAQSSGRVIEGRVEPERTAEVSEEAEAQGVQGEGDDV